jgi:flagellar export protein FliJ
LEGLVARRAAIQQQLEQARDCLRRLQTMMQATLEQAASAAEIQFAVAQQKAMDEKQRLLRADLQRLAAEIAEQSQRYRTARRQREVLEALRASQLRVYQGRERRREQARQDELFLLRRGRRDGFA